MDNLRELVRIICDEQANSSVTPCAFSGSVLGGSSDYLYCGILTAEPGDVQLLGPGLLECEAVPGLPQVFQSAVGSAFYFVGYRIYTPSSSVPVL